VAVVRVSVPLYDPALRPQTSGEYAFFRQVNTPLTHIADGGQMLYKPQRVPPDPVTGIALLTIPRSDGFNPPAEWGIGASNLLGAEYVGTLPNTITDNTILTIEDLVQSFGWQITQAVPPVATAPGLDAVRWATPIAWDAATTYFPGQGVFYSNSSWRALLENINSPPSLENPNWAPIALSSLAFGVYDANNYATFAEAVAAVTALLSGTPGVLSVSAPMTVTDSMVVPPNIALAFTGSGKLTITDTSTATTLVSGWSHTTVGTVTLPANTIPVSTVNTLTLNSVAGITIGDVAVLTYADPATTAVSQVAMTITGIAGAVVTFSFPISQGGAGTALVIPAGSTLAQGYAGSTAQNTVASVLKLASIPLSMQVDDDVLIGDNAIRMVRDKTTNELYTPDTGERSSITAIDRNAGTITILPGCRFPHVNESVTTHRQVTISGPFIAPVTSHIFDASANGENGFGKLIFPFNSTEKLWAEWFGAVGDATASGGGTDSTAAINAMIMAVPANGGIDQCFNGAAYRISAPLEIHNSSKFNYRNSMRFFGRGVQLDIIPQGPTTFFWTGNGTDPMWRVWSRNNQWHGCWFQPTTATVCNMFFDVDRAGNADTCSSNAWESCTFGVIKGILAQKHLTGIRIGFRNSNNCDFMRWNNCTFIDAQPDDINNPTQGTGCGVYVPNTTAQAAAHQYTNCDFRGQSQYDAFPVYQSMLYGMYYVSGQPVTTQCHYYYCRTEMYVGACTMDITINGGDSENCQQMLYNGSGASCPTTIIGRRFACNFMLTDPVAGMECVSITSGPLLLQGCIFNPGSPTGVNPNFKIHCTGSATAISCLFPNYNPFDLSVPVNATLWTCRVKSGVTDKDIPYQFLQGTNQSPTGSSNDGTAWFNAPLGVAPMGTFQLTPPGPTTVFQTFPPFMRVSKSGAAGGPNVGFHWYTLTRILKTGVEMPTGYAVHYIQQTQLNVNVVMPPAVNSTDVGWGIYRAVGTDTTTVPAPSAFRKAGTLAATGSKFATGGFTTGPTAAGSGTGFAAATAYNFRWDAANSVGSSPPGAISALTPGSPTNVAVGVLISNVTITSVGIYASTDAAPKLVGSIPVLFTPGTGWAVNGAVPAGLTVTSFVTSSGTFGTLNVTISAVGTGGTGATVNTTQGGMGAGGAGHYFIDAVDNTTLAAKPQYAGYLVPQPSTAPTAALAGVPGTMALGSHVFAISNIDGSGNESFAGPVSNAATITTSFNAQIDVTVPSGSGLTHHIYGTTAGTITPLYRVTGSPVADGAVVRVNTTDGAMPNGAQAIQALPAANYHYLLSAVDADGGETTVFSTSDDDIAPLNLPGRPSMTIPAFVPGAQTFNLYRATYAVGADAVHPASTNYVKIDALPALTTSTTSPLQVYSDSVLAANATSTNPPLTNTTAPPMFDVRGKARYAGDLTAESSFIMKGAATPPLSAAGTARWYYNAANQQLMLSQNGGAYFQFVPITPTDVVVGGELILSDATAPTVDTANSTGAGTPANGATWTFDSQANKMGGIITIVAGSDHSVNFALARVQLSGHSKRPRSVDLSWGGTGLHGIAGTLSYRNLSFSGGVVSFDIFSSTTLTTGNTYDINFEIHL
jgi:hypothetical protein